MPEMRPAIVGGWKAARRRWTTGTALAGLSRSAPALIAAATLVQTALAGSALAQNALSGGNTSAPALFSPAEMDRSATVALAVMLGIAAVAAVTSIQLLRTRRRAAAREGEAAAEIAALQARLDRASALLLADPQAVLIWSAGSDTPEVLGNPALLGDAAGRLLAFGTWLDPQAAGQLDRAVAGLRDRGEGFAMTLSSRTGQPLEADGRIVGGQAVVRLRDVTGTRRELMELAARCHELQTGGDALRALVEQLPAPAWVRDSAGALRFANPAYARAVEAADVAAAVSGHAELFDRAARRDLLQAQSTGTAFSGRLPAVVAGERRSFDVFAASVPDGGSAGIAFDASTAEKLRTDIARLAEAHRRTLDHLATGVAIFDAGGRLVFYNAAYRLLWDLDPAFLDQGPSDSIILDRLRSARKLPEQSNFRQWKAELHEAYRATDAQPGEWHLPDGRTLRVVTTPNPEGGVTYLFDDVTEGLNLARRYDALIRVQGETLDNLAEAVAVFGSDGRLRLSNPSFARLWRLSPEELAERPHVEAVIAACRRLHDAPEIWRALHGTITAIEDRTPVSGRMERRDGSVLDCATVPLPDGATLVAFRDMTDSVNVERALIERNEALEAADRLKIDFVHHVSYELRSPLTNIIGFAEFLNDPATGSLSERQQEYLGYITSSTNALLALINNILDLATIDAGAMTLSLGEVDIRATMEAAAEGVRDRLVKDDIHFEFRVSPGIGSFVADERRVRQVLFNLLSNAVGFSPPGETVTFVAQRTADTVVFSVTDHGPGIPDEVQERVFDWFETRSQGSSHRGTGLGLSLVRSFVELHGGVVSLNSVVGRGTTVTCVFPADRGAQRNAAE